MKWCSAVGGYNNTLPLYAYFSISINCAPYAGFANNVPRKCALLRMGLRCLKSSAVYTCFSAL
jgi:hypothetical protein